MSVLPVGIGAELGGYQIERSLRFNSADSAYLNRTPASASNRKTWTWSGWVKRSKLGEMNMLFMGRSNGTNYDQIRWNSDDTIYFFGQNAGADSYRRNTTPVYRDVSSWYHIVGVLDTTQATAADRVKLYINGVQVTAFSSSSNPTQNFDSYVNNTNVHFIGGNNIDGMYSDQYMTEVNFIDGQALTPTDFGEFNSDTGVWQPIKYTGTYGTNGFYLNFSDNASTTTLGDDFSGNGNDWTTNNFSVTAGAGNDSLVDSPTRYGTDTGAGGEVRGNYCTLNPLRNGGFTLSNGNLDFGGTTSDRQVAGTIAFPTSGKWYFEAVPTAIGANSYWGVGIMNTTVTVTSGGLATEGFEGYAATGLKFSGAGYVSYGNSFTTNDVIGVAVDMDNGAIYFAKNNTWQNSGDPTSGSSKTGAAFTDLISSGYTWTPAIFSFNTGQSGITNFGQRPFAYTAPSGFKALVTTNLPEPTIADGGEYFNTVLYTGNATAGRAITGVGFAPDLVWIKNRSASVSHILSNKLGANGNYLSSNNTDFESVVTDVITSLDSDGFTVGTNVTTNGSGNAIVAWNWKANGAGVSNTDGTITSTVSVNTTSGFSIITFNGTGSNATVGHGLGVAPSMVIFKQRNNAGFQWPVYHASLATDKFLFLQRTDGQITSSTMWQNTRPTSTVIYLGPNGNDNNNTSSNMVAYCFAPVAGYSAFGSYTGNAAADGPFIYTGFRPEFVMIKASSSTGDWVMEDVARSPYNVSTNYLVANASTAEQTGQLVDFLSNGFKIRVAVSGAMNGSGTTYIYMAFAENPFAYSLAR